MEQLALSDVSFILPSRNRLQDSARQFRIHHGLVLREIGHLPQLNVCLAAGTWRFLVRDELGQGCCAHLACVLLLNRSVALSLVCCSLTEALSTGSVGHISEVSISMAASNRRSLVSTSGSMLLCQTVTNRDV